MAVVAWWCLSRNQATSKLEFVGIRVLSCLCGLGRVSSPGINLRLWSLFGLPSQRRTLAGNASETLKIILCVGCHQHNAGFKSIICGCPCTAQDSEHFSFSSHFWMEYPLYRHTSRTFHHPGLTGGCCWTSACLKTTLRKPSIRRCERVPRGIMTRRCSKMSR